MRRGRGSATDEGDEAAARRADGVGAAAAAQGEGLPRRGRDAAHAIDIAVLIYKLTKEMICTGSCRSYVGSHITGGGGAGTSRLQSSDSTCVGGGDQGRLPHPAVSLRLSSRPSPHASVSSCTPHTGRRIQPRKSTPNRKRLRLSVSNAPGSSAAAASYNPIANPGMPPPSHLLFVGVNEGHDDGLVSGSGGAPEDRPGARDAGAADADGARVAAGGEGFPFGRAESRGKRTGSSTWTYRRHGIPHGRANVQGRARLQDLRKSQGQPPYQVRGPASVAGPSLHTHTPPPPVVPRCLTMPACRCRASRACVMPSFDPTHRWDAQICPSSLLGAAALA